MLRRILAGASLAALWLVWGFSPYVLQAAGGAAATVGRVIPSPLRAGFLELPGDWAVALHVVALLVIVAGYAMITTWFARRTRVTFAAGWIAAVITGFLIGAVLDIGEFAEWVGLLGIRSALGHMGAVPVTVAWALLVGWIPAIIVSVNGQPATNRSEAARTWPTAVVSGVALCAAIALPFTAQGADDALRAQLREDQAAAEAAALANKDPDGAASRDPEATGIPVPSVAPVAAATAVDACTPANSTILAPTADAATGHRLQQLQLVNTSAAPCTVEGYPDVAFGDQNGHLMDVSIAAGDSFLADDAGPVAISLAPGDSAVASLGWDANSVIDSLAARSLWAAQFASAERLSWEVSLDIVPGATVHVTAWEEE